jgi:hypothetical protein
MPFYFGLPVTCQEVFRLFSLDFEQVKCDIMQKHSLSENMYMDCYFADYLNNFFRNKKLTLRINYLDKGQCILGYHMIQVCNFQKNFVNVDRFIIQLTNMKTLFAMETEQYRENFREVVLEHMEDEPETVEFPQPYIIEFNT